MAFFRDLKGYIQILEKKINKNDSIISIKDEEEDEENDYSFNINLTGDTNLKINKFTNEFFSGLEDEFLFKKRKMKNKICENKNHSLDEINLNKYGVFGSNCKKDKKNNKNNDNNMIMNFDKKKKKIKI